MLQNKYLERDTIRPIYLVKMFRKRYADNKETEWDEIASKARN